MWERRGEDEEEADAGRLVTPPPSAPKHHRELCHLDSTNCSGDSLNVTFNMGIFKCKAKNHLPKLSGVILHYSLLPSSHAHLLSWAHSQQMCTASFIFSKADTELFRDERLG